MIQLLKYDLKHIVRGNIYLIIMFALIFAGNYMLDSTMYNNWDLRIFDMWIIFILLLLIDLLSKGVTINIFSNFPVETYFFLKYLQTKFLVLTSIVFFIYILFLKIFMNVNIFLLIPFYILVIYFSLSYYFIVCLYLTKTTKTGLIQTLVLILLLIILYLFYNFLFSFFGYFIGIPIIFISIVFNYFIKYFAKILSPFLYKILESSNASN